MLDKILNRLSKYFKSVLKGVEVRRVKGIESKEPAQIKLAKKYLDMHETDLRIKNLVGFNSANIPWCAGFINSIEKLCGRKGTGKLLARRYLKYGIPTTKPSLGDIVVFKRGNSSWQGHVAYFVADKGKNVLVLGGNQSDKVCYALYPKDKVLGYRMP